MIWKLLEQEVRDIASKAIGNPQLVLMERGATYDTNDYLNSWFAPSALESLLAYRALIS